MSISMRPRSLGEVLDGAFQMLREDFGLYALTAIICLAPMTLIYAFSFTGSESTAVLLGVLVLLPIGIVGALTCWPALTYQMEDRLNGEASSVGSGLRRGVRMVLRMVGLTIVGYLAMFAGGVVVALGGGLVVVALGAINEILGLAIGIPIAIALAVFLTVTIASRLFLLLPVAVIEDVGVFASLRRAADLTAGARVSTSALLFVSWILLALPTIAILFLSGMAGAIVSAEGATATLPLGTVVLQQGLSLVATGVTAPFMVAVMVLGYYDRRIRAEGYDLESAAADLLE